MGSRKKGQPRREAEEAESVSRDFGPCTVRVDFRTGRVIVTEFGEVEPDDRNEATGWAIRQLAAVGLPVNNPMTLRDSMWG